MVTVSPKNPNITDISENDKRVLRSHFYTSPSALLLLEIHFSGNYGLSLLSNQNGYGLMLAAGCRECVATAPQGNAQGESNAAQGNPTATAHAIEGTITHLGSASSSMRSRGKKCPRTFSGGGVQGNLLNTLSSKIAAVRRRAKAKGKWAQRASLWDANPSSEETSDISSQEGCDQEVELHMFIECPVHHLAVYICFYLKALATT